MVISSVNPIFSALHSCEWAIIGKLRELTAHLGEKPQELTGHALHVILPTRDDEDDHFVFMVVGYGFLSSLVPLWLSLRSIFDQLTHSAF